MVQKYGDQDMLYGLVVAREGSTTDAGAPAGNSAIDTALIGFGAGSFEMMKFIVYPGDPARVDAFDIPIGGFNNATGEITLSHNYKGGQIPAGAPYCILPLGAGSFPAPVLSPSIGLWMFGQCDPGMTASTTTLSISNLAGFRDDIFNDDFYLEVIHNNNNAGFAPEHEIRKITDYATAGVFTCDAFTANVEENDLVAVIHHSLIGPELNVVSTLVRAIFDIVNASLVTSETGGTLTADGTEQNLYINNAPSNVYEPLVVQLDCTNMAAGDTVVLRTYYRIKDGGNWIKKDQLALSDDQDPDLKNIALEPNRYGVKVTLEQTAGVNREYDWEVIYRM